MTPDDLQQADPALFAAVTAIGVAAERERVARHLKWGDRCIDLSIARTAIADGSGFDPTMMERYTDAMMRRMGVDLRQRESDETEAILSGVARGGAGAGDAAEIELARELNKLMGPPPAKETQNARLF